MNEQNKKGVNPNRYILLLNDIKKSTVNKVQEQLNIKLVSSVELNSQVRAETILNDENGIVFKNINIVVVDDVEEEKVSRISKSLIHWEREREFFPVDGIDDIKQIRKQLNYIHQSVDSLEDYIKTCKSKKESFDKSMTWALESVGIPKTSYTGKGIDVCILDTGFYAAHPDFTGRNIIGKSFIKDEDWDHDGNGHGTHCAGTAVGNVSSTEGKRYGVAKDANLVVGKVLADSGTGTTSSIVDAIDWAIEKKYKIVSMSLGASVAIGEDPSPIFEEIGKQALAKNTLLIGAAGNDSNRPDFPRPVSTPANTLSIMAVGAIDQDLNIASFSNAGINLRSGGKVDIVAPGVDIFSSYSKNAPGNNIYKTLNGTSMATPHIAGLAALYCQAFPQKSTSEIWLGLEKHAKLLHDQLSRDVGSGLAQVPQNNLM